jgi:polyadenylate-binding protein
MSSPTPSTTIPPTTTGPAGAPAPKPPSASLYVGDLAPEVNEGMLADIFTTVGPLSSIRVCRDTLTRRSLGYAYVNFHSAVDAERALDALNNYVLAGRPCRIMWSQRDPSIRKTGVGNIFIKNLSPEIGHKELYDTFSAFGNILSCKVAMDEHGQSKGYGFVHFENQQCADNAVQTVNNNLLLEKKVFVGPFVPRRVRAQQLEKSWTNVFIKDIDLAVSNEELQRAFSEYGLVTSAVIMRKDDGSSLGFGFVNFAEHESAMRAVDGMHGAKVGNKALYCCRAQKKAEREAKLRKEWEQQKNQ